MITVNGMIVKYLGYTTPKVEIVSRGSDSFYKTLLWSVGKPLNKGTIQVEVAKQWKVTPSEIVILDNVEIPQI